MLKVNFVWIAAAMYLGMYLSSLHDLHTTFLPYNILVVEDSKCSKARPRLLCFLFVNDAIKLTHMLVLRGMTGTQFGHFI